MWLLLNILCISHHYIHSIHYITSILLPIKEIGIHISLDRGGVLVTLPSHIVIICPDTNVLNVPHNNILNRDNTTKDNCGPFSQQHNFAITTRHNGETQILFGHGKIFAPIVSCVCCLHCPGYFSLRCLRNDLSPGFNVNPVPFVCSNVITINSKNHQTFLLCLGGL